MQDPGFLTVAYSRTALPEPAAPTQAMFEDELPIATYRTALLQLVPVQEKLEDALDVLQSAIRVMENVEHRYAAPSGIQDWNFRDQVAIHRQLAVSVRAAAIDLESYTAQLVSVFEDAEVGIRRLTEPQLAQYGRQMAPIVETVSGLSDLSRRLLSRVVLVLDNLHSRVMISGDYYVVIKALEDTCRHIDHVSRIAISMRNYVNRL